MKTDSGLDWDLAPQERQAPAPAAESLHVGQVRALLASLRRARRGQGRSWKVRIRVEDAQGRLVYPSVLGSIEVVQGLREDLVYLGYQPVGTDDAATYVFRHPHGVRRR